jgi:hypothetical protein
MLPCWLAQGCGAMIELLQTPNISPTSRATLDLEEILDEKKESSLTSFKNFSIFSLKFFQFKITLIVQL